LSEPTPTRDFVTLPPVSRRRHPSEWVEKWRQESPQGTAIVVRNDYGRYQSDVEGGNGQWWITDDIYYFMKDGLVYRYKFS
jgi:hypothetical protein